MVLVEGDHCVDAEQVCLKWLDPPPYQNLRCGEYAKPAKCKGARIQRRFCIDREEFAEVASSPRDDLLPVVGKSWGEAKTLCEARGARLCKEAEWEFACEGPEMSPYPYGWKRDSTLCNLDKTGLGGLGNKLKDLRAPLSAFPGCNSPFGVHNMVGNVDEWVADGSFVGGFYARSTREGCDARISSHAPEYFDYSLGTRCCGSPSSLQAR